MPLVPGACGIAVLEPADEGEIRALVLAGGAELQGGMVVEYLGALADLAQRVAGAHDRRMAEAADGERRRRRAELDRRAAVRAGGPVGALRRRFCGQVTMLMCKGGVDSTPPLHHRRHQASFFNRSEERRLREKGTCR